MIEIKNNQVYSTEGKIVHRIGHEVYFKRSTILTSDTVDNFEEVDEIPKYNKAQYEAKVAELVRKKYTESEEFALQRKAINTLVTPSTLSNEDKDSIMEEYSAYNLYVEDCKVQAKEILSNPDTPVEP